MKKALKKTWAFSNLISLLQKHLFSYVEFKDFFDNMDTYIQDYEKNKGSPEEIARQIALEFA